MLHRSSLLAVAFLSLAAPLAACGSPDVTFNPPIDGGPVAPPAPASETPTSDNGPQVGARDAGGPPSAGDSGAKADSGALNGCVAFDDRTALDAGKVVVDLGGGGKAADPFNPRCVTVRVGQSITFEGGGGGGGGGGGHPLAPLGGMTPSPFAALAPPNGALTLKFTAMGDYGYGCTRHKETTGVVRVVP